MRKPLLVADIMTPDPVTVTPATTLQEAVRLMMQGGFRRLPVVDEEGQLIGIVTDRDLRLATDSPVVLHERGEREYLMTHVTVGACMTPDPITVEPSTPAADAIRRMRDHRIGGLPVVMGDELVGIVTVTDILDAFLKFLESPKSTRKEVLMVHLELTEEQAAMLRDILESYLSNLRMEIASTESKDLRDKLKEGEVFVKDLIQRLQVGGL